MITADKVFKGSTEILRVYRGTTLEWEKPIPIPGADAYIQNGLVFQLDGIERGNVEGVWKDLIEGREFTLNNCILNSNNVEFNGTDSYAVDNNNWYFPSVPSNFTYEVVMYYYKGSVLSDSRRGSSSIGTPILYSFYDSEKYTAISRYQQAVEGLPKNKYMCFQVRGDSNAPKANLNGTRLSYRSGTDTSMSQNLYEYGHSQIGCLQIDATDSGRAGFFKGKIYAIRIYNRTLTEQELFDNMLIDYRRFNIDIMDKFTVNLSNDLGEKINEAQFVINNTLVNYTGSPVYIPKSPRYFIQFNNISQHTAPKAIINLQSPNISAVYHYTGFEGMIFEATVPDSDKEVRLPYYSSVQQVDWGDGTSDTSISHTYSASGTYTIKLLGNFTNVNFYSEYGRDIGKNVTKILQFPYNITLYDGIFSAPQLIYLAPLISNIELNVFNAKNVDMLDCYSSFANYPATASSFYGHDINSPSLSENVDTFVMTGGDGYISSVKHIQNLYKMQVKQNTHFIANSGNSPYITYIFSKMPKIEYMEIPREIFEFYGNSINWDFSKNTNWGTGDSRISVVNTLVNNTVDLVSEKYKSQTITLASTTKALLTEDEIAQITAKGYTLA